MKKYITTYSFFLFFLGFSSLALLHGQESKLKKASESYENLNYVNAQKVYLAVAEKGYQSEELFTKLGNSYYFNAQYDQAVKWYQSLFDLNAAPEDAIVYLRFSQALKATGQSEKSAQYYNDFVVKNGSQTNLKTTIDYKKLIQENSGRYQIEAIDKIYDESLYVEVTRSYVRKDSHSDLIESLFFDLDETSFKRMKITLGPKTTLAEKIIVEALIAKFNPDATFESSELNNVIR